ncbi:MAG: hypothetical protein IKF24_04505 [Eubacterium sp.]|nr:hypothetical protein [Eubacterium sp.]
MKDTVSEKEKKNKLSDVFESAKEELANFTASEVLPEVVREFGPCIVNEAVSEIVGYTLAAVSPRVFGFRLAYKQNRLERNVKIMFSELIERADMMEERIEQLNNDEYVKKVTEMLLDQIVDEIQELKVKYLVNGYINILSSDNTNDDMALMFFKTLSQLSDLDIRVLRVYARETDETLNDIIEEIGINIEQLKYIKEKLERFGLLQSRKEKDLDENLEVIIKYLRDVEIDNRKTKPKGIKVPKLKRIWSQDSYSITKLGRNYLELIYVNSNK